MTPSFIQDGAKIRIESRKPWWAVFFALPVFYLSYYLLRLVAFAVQDFREHAVNEFLFVFILFVVGLALGWIGLVILSRRSTVIDRSQGLVERTLRIGPFRWRRHTRELSGFHVIRILWEPDTGNRGGTYVVNLSGEAGTDLVPIDGFANRPPAIELARELGNALNLPYKDESGCEPEEYPEDLEDGDEAGEAAAERGQV
jgi:hypothetical protein